MKNSGYSLASLDAEHCKSPQLRSLLGIHSPEFERALLEHARIHGITNCILCDGEPAGVVSVSPEGELSVAVHETYQRRGLASLAVAETVQQVLSDDSKALTRLCLRPTRCMVQSRRSG